MRFTPDHTHLRAHRPTCGRCTHDYLWLSSPAWSLGYAGVAFNSQPDLFSANARTDAFHSLGLVTAHFSPLVHDDLLIDLDVLGAYRQPDKPAPLPRHNGCFKLQRPCRSLLPRFARTSAQSRHLRTGARKRPVRCSGPRWDHSNAFRTRLPRKPVSDSLRVDEPELSVSGLFSVSLTG